MTRTEARDRVAAEEAESLARLLTAGDDGAFVIVLTATGDDASLHSATTPRLNGGTLAAFVQLLGDERDRLAGVLARASANG